MLARPRIASLLIAAAFVLCAGWLATVLADERRLADANALALQHRYAEAADEASRVDGRATSARAARVEAYAHMAQRDVTRARTAVVRALEEVPTDWELRRDWAVALAVTGRRAAAAAQMQRALALNPRMQLPYGFRRASGR